MSQATVEKGICKTCGADVRPQADYCYNCGGAVSTSAIEKKSVTASENVNSAEEKTIEEKPETNSKIAVDTIENQAPKIEKKASVSEQTKLKTAASLRRQSKSLERKTVEVVWEEHDDAPNILFISGAVFLTLVAAAILFLAMYLK